MADILTQAASLAALNATFAAASVGGDAFANTGNEILIVKNGGAAPVTITINSVEKCSQGFDHDITVSVPAGEQRMIGTFQKKRFNDADGKVAVTYSDVTSVTVAVVQVAAS